MQTVLTGQYKACGTLQVKGKTAFMGSLMCSTVMVMEVGEEHKWR